MKTEAFNYLPKPLDDWMVDTVAIFILCVFSPVVHINVSQATHKKLHNKKCQTVGKKNGYKSPVLNVIMKLIFLTSSSFSSKILMRSCGISSKNP